MPNTGTKALNTMKDITTDEQATVLNPVQLHLLRMFSYMNSETQPPTPTIAEQFIKIVTTASPFQQIIV